MTTKESWEDDWIEMMQSQIGIGRGNYVTAENLLQMGLTEEQVKLIEKMGSGYARMEWLQEHNFWNKR